MNTVKSFLTFCLIAIAIIACKETPSETTQVEDVRTQIEMVTTKGTMVLELYNETPKHRDNFIKIANDKVLDSVLFHRVIEGFMIQGGDPDSKTAQPGERLGSGGLGYKVDAEFLPELFHKKGVLAAARDGNLQRASSSTQFYIVQGDIIENDSLIDRDQERINGWLAEHYFKNDPLNKALVDSVQSAIDSKNWDNYRLYNDSIKVLAENYTNFDKYSIPAGHREVYKTLGGVPFLDQNYTVFGEVVQGLEIVDSIAGVETDPNDRPVEDVRILSVKVIKEE